MTTSAVEMGFFDTHQHMEKPYYPSFPLSPIKEAIRQLSKLEQQNSLDNVLLAWIRYFDHAAEGSRIYIRAIKEHVVDGSLEDAHACTYFKEIGLPEDTYEKNLKNISSVRRAFASLLSKDTKKKLKLKRKDTHASATDVHNATIFIENHERATDFILSPADDLEED